MRMNLLDKVIHYINPVKGQERFQARVSVAAASSFTGASRSKGALKGWFTSRKPADEDINPELDELRARSRDLERNNALAHGAINTKAVYVVGTGLRPEPNIDYEFLGLTSEEAETLQGQIAREFNLVAESREADIARRKTFYQKQFELYHSSKVNGDAFLLLPYLNRADFPYQTKFQSIESDRVSNPNLQRDDEKYSAGFQLDRYGAIKGIHIKTKIGNKPTWRYVPLFASNGRPNVLIASNKNTRASQTRGIPDLSPVIEVIKQCGRYVDAELMAAVISSKFTVFVKSSSPEAADAFAPNAGGASHFDDEAEEKISEERPEYRLGDGLVVQLDEDESIETANPGRPNAVFDPFVTVLWKHMGAALGIPFEILVKHFSASYSASKAALLQFAHFIAVDRANLVVDICQPYYETIIAEAVANGRLHMPGFLNDLLIRKAYTRALWHGPVLGDIDEVKAANAAEKRLNIGISTHEVETRRLLGHDWDQINQRRIIEERKKYKPTTTESPATEPGFLMDEDEAQDDE
ncbi:phage portal protein [Spartinivicinus poritis]|uniref:Phage portal protein n=1 Tax=Spartinivicinus poritis TaxID=2994640 RepID=A0ABT5UEJ7_9GAMM|nr:phage portal protein [Spartinivicinus sp. A2-2]MDE1464797.1 phage portal protein [Spartinivicinus sp. A2-2]